jgi:hypothetical protein
MLKPWSCKETVETGWPDRYREYRMEDGLFSLDPRGE